jgi:hypothetical protein
MLLASERHRGFWELANLMTRPSSLVGALKRWGDKPVDVRLDVVDALPCASETFLAQLDTVPSADARALRGACETRARVDKETCALDAALAHTKSRARLGGASPEAATFAEAVLVRHLAARCRSAAFVAEARAWATTKPEALAKVVVARLPHD